MIFRFFIEISTIICKIIIDLNSEKKPISIIDADYSSIVMALWFNLINNKKIESQGWFKYKSKILIIKFYLT